MSEKKGPLPRKKPPQSVSLSFVLTKEPDGWYAQLLLETKSMRKLYEDCMDLVGFSKTSADAAIKNWYEQYRKTVPPLVPRK